MLALLLSLNSRHNFEHFNTLVIKISTPLNNSQPIEYSHYLITKTPLKEVIDLSAISSENILDVTRVPIKNKESSDTKAENEKRFEAFFKILLEKIKGQFLNYTHYPYKDSFYQNFLNNEKIKEKLSHEAQSEENSKKICEDKRIRQLPFVIQIPQQDEIIIYVSLRLREGLLLYQESLLKILLKNLEIKYDLNFTSIEIINSTTLLLQ
jgi:hypothetical protein